MTRERSRTPRFRRCSSARYGAELAPLGTVEAAAQAWDKEQELVLVCRSGNRSGHAAAALTAMASAVR
jgi:rhodanese-related sulfurtransferase